MPSDEQIWATYQDHQSQGKPNAREVASALGTTPKRVRSVVTRHQRPPRYAYTEREGDAEKAEVLASWISEITGIGDVSRAWVHRFALDLAVRVLDQGVARLYVGRRAITLEAIAKLAGPGERTGRSYSYSVRDDDPARYASIHDGWPAAVEHEPSDAAAHRFALELAIGASEHRCWHVTGDPVTSIRAGQDKIDLRALALQAMRRS